MAHRMKRFMTPILHWVLAFQALALVGCFEDRPPRGFDPVPPTTMRQPPDQCPDLSGLTFDLADTPLARALFDRQAPSLGVPYRLVFRRGVSHEDAWWVVPRQEIQRIARDLQATDPERYDRWRTLVLQESLGGSRDWDFDGWLKAVTEIGPPARLFAGRASFACKDNWTRARDQSLRETKDSTTEREIWLARDRSGDLLVKDITYRLKSYSTWGGNTGYLRIGATTTWSRVTPAAPESSEKLGEEDLPPSGVLDVAASAEACANQPDRLVAFAQRIRESLPAGVELAAFLPQPAPEQTRRDCSTMVVELQFESRQAEALAAVDAIVRGGPEVQSLDVLPLVEATRWPRRRLRVELH